MQSLILQRFLFPLYITFIIRQMPSQQSNSQNERQKQDFCSAFEQLNEEIESIVASLTHYYEQAVDSLEGGNFIVNTSVMKQLRLYLSQIVKLVSNAGSGANLFLLSMNAQESVQQESVEDVQKFVYKYRHSFEYRWGQIGRMQLENGQLTRIKSRCLGVNSISLISNGLKMEEIINDQDLLKLMEFKKVSRLSLRGSNVSEEGLRTLSESFQNLKEIDISDCRLVGNSGLRWLTGYKYVSVKANQTEGITERAVLNLISTSYNLNFLEICNIKHFDYQSLLQEIEKVYQKNKMNFKWLNIVCNLGTILYVNKLSYLTHLTNADSITDREVEVLLGEQPQLDGLYFNCCEELHSDTVRYLIRKCLKLRRLGLRRFVNLTDSLVGDIVSNMIRLDYLDLSQCCSLTSNALIQVANQLQKLRHIKLNRCIGLNDNGLLYLIQKMPTLVTINIAFCKNMTDNVIYQICNNLPNLVSLDVTKCEQITNDAISYVSEKLQNLQCLVLNGCQTLNDECLSLVAMRLRKLKQLQIEWCGASQKCVDFIAENLNELQILNINYCPAIYDGAIVSLSKRAVKLRSLSLASSNKITTKAFLKLFEPLKKLQYLDLKQCSQVDDLVIECICGGSRGELMHLDLGWCTSITDRGLLNLSQFHQQLLYLSLNGCSEITDSGIGWICSSMTNLQYLNLTLCDGLTDKSVLEISKNLPNLRILYLCELKSLTDTSLSTLSGVSNLQELHLSGCVQITSSSLIALLHNLEKLQCLNISECSNIFAQSLLLLIERMRNLKRFYMGSLQVDNQLLQMIAQYMHRLQSLSLQYCRKISDEGVLDMVYRTSSLLRIDLQNTPISQKTKKVIFEQLSSRGIYDFSY